jgi:hypothetical protein
MRRLRVTLGFGLLIGGIAWAGCSSGNGHLVALDGGGGSVSSSAASRAAPASNGATTGSGDGGVTCVGGVTDGKCEPLLGEDCKCGDCASTAFCVTTCDDQLGVCDPIYDACSCPDCFTSHACSSPTHDNCKKDGKCDSFHEGCACDDCKQVGTCEEAIMQCLDKKLDQFCDISEPCDCPDCFGVPRCLPCNVDGTCAPAEPCTCADCAGTSYCMDPANCEDDGICDALIEGCLCNDCSWIPECNGMMP